MQISNKLKTRLESLRNSHLAAPLAAMFTAVDARDRQAIDAAGVWLAEEYAAYELNAKRLKVRGELLPLNEVRVEPQK